MKIVSVLALALSACSLVACASGEKPRYTRGWIGGMTSIATNDVWTALAADGGSGHGTIYGLPEGLPSESALLVEAAHPMTPLADAGVQPGDLIVSLDGEVMEEPLELRETIEGTEPGSLVTMRVWRAGEILELPVTVGTETYHKEGRVSFGIGLPITGGTIDLWPFDDGFDILGLVHVKTDETRHEMWTVRGDYVRAIHGADSSPLAPQETLDIHVLVLGLGKSIRVDDQSKMITVE